MWCRISGGSERNVVLREKGNGSCAVYAVGDCGNEGRERLCVVSAVDKTSASRRKMREGAEILSSSSNDAEEGRINSLVLSIMPLLYAKSSASSRALANSSAGLSAFAFMASTL